jgi:hypothetical protein
LEERFEGNDTPAASLPSGRASDSVSRYKRFANDSWLMMNLLKYHIYQTLIRLFCHQQRREAEDQGMRGRG